MVGGGRQSPGGERELERRGRLLQMAEQAGWKDVVFVPGKALGPGGANSVVKFIAKFEDYADSIHPFMYHCHISLHEDEGMMGQFVVTGATTGLENNTEAKYFSIYPNPATNKLYISFEDPESSAYYIKINNAFGRTVYMLPRPETKNGIDISHLTTGIYFLQLTDEKTKITTTKKFIKE